MEKVNRCVASCDDDPSAPLLEKRENSEKNQSLGTKIIGQSKELVTSIEEIKY